MKVEHVSGSLFTIELTAGELAHCLGYTLANSDDLIHVIKLIWDVGFQVSKLIEEQASVLCERKN